MSNVRQIIKLYSQQMGKKKISERLGMSKNTVKLYIEQFHKLKEPWFEPLTSNLQPLTSNVQPLTSNLVY